MKSIYYIQDKLKLSFYDEHVEVRKTVSSVMSMIIVRGGFNAWPDLLEFLTNNISVNNLKSYMGEALQTDE
jgi:hypothetical protein